MMMKRSWHRGDDLGVQRRLGPQTIFALRKRLESASICLHGAAPTAAHMRQSRASTWAYSGPTAWAYAWGHDMGGVATAWQIIGENLRVSSRARLGAPRVSRPLDASPASAAPTGSRLVRIAKLYRPGKKWFFFFAAGAIGYSMPSVGPSP